MASSLHLRPEADDVVRGGVAAAQGVALAHAATVLYDAGGKRVLSAGAQKMLRTAAQSAAGNVLGEAAFVAPVSLLEAGTKRVAASVGTIGSAAAKSAGRGILKGAGRAAGLGFALDGAIAGVQAVRAVRAGTMTKKSALAHVGKEATSGALATAAGTLACVGLVALTGPVAMPALFLWGAGCTFGAKTALRRLMK